MSTRKLSFDNRRGRRLGARLDVPRYGPPAAAALLAHCFTCGKDLKGLVQLSRTLTEHGFAVLRIDMTGIGESEGEFAESGLAGDAEDLQDAAEVLSAEIAPPALLVGHSFGGAAALLAAPRIASLRALATIAAPAEPAHMTSLFPGAEEQAREEGAAEVAIAGRAFRLPDAFLQELASTDPTERLARLGVPLMILHAVTDEVVAIDHATRLFMAAKHPKSFVSLGDAGHLLPRRRDARFAGNVIGAWAAALLEPESRRPLGDPRPVPRTTAREAPDEERRTLAVTGAGLATDGTIGGFPVRLDEPESVGGTDTGPAPMQLLRAALASCSSITMRMYADRKGWPLESATVEVDSTSVRRNGSMHTTYTRTIAMTGPLTEAQRERLMQIADRCPVHRALEGDVHIATVAHPDVEKPEPLRAATED